MPCPLVVSSSCRRLNSVLALGILTISRKFGDSLITEEAVLQALELMTRGQDGTVWIRAVMLREKVARLIGQPVEKMGDTQWIGHILKRLHLLDEAGRKRGMDGITYAVKSSDVIDMMRRYDVPIVYKSP